MLCFELDFYQLLIPMRAALMHRLSPAELLARWKLLLQDGDLTIESDRYELNNEGTSLCARVLANIH
ncbi:hypothetical protein AWV79_14170 [Cupriavidus sp. UYMMa02A]|nr:hypothetical protein AWV79_14170 [Cupriavidus sp. UYMMa02A]